MKLHHYDDGKTHLNVYSRGATPLGKLLSNFAHTPFTLDDHGTFASVEGYWYWLSTKDERLRHLHGFAAKKLGREVRTQVAYDPTFKTKINKAIRAKLDQHPPIVALLRQSTLPFVHYYVTKGKVQDRTEESQWMLDIYEEYRK